VSFSFFFVHPNLLSIAAGLKMVSVVVGRLLVGVEFIGWK